MTAARMPVVASAFAAGIMAWPVVGGVLPVTAWLALALSALVAGPLVALRERRGDPLQRAGLIEALSRSPREALLAPASRWSSAQGVVLAGLVVLGVVLAGVGWGGLHERRIRGALLRELSPATVSVEGSLREDPRARTLGWSVVLDASEVHWDEGAASVHETVWVGGHGTEPDAVRGDRVRVEGLVRVPEEGSGFGDSLLRRGIVAELSAREIERIGPSSNPLVRAAQAVRRVVGRSIRELFPPAEAGLLLGLALGDDSGLDEGVERDFRATGLGHLLVVSGGNVAMVLAPVLALGLALRLGRWPRFALALGTVVFFVVLTGAEPSVMRAGVMAGLALTGTLLGRPRSAGAVLSAAVLVLLVVDPSLVWSVGFQLSVVATASMVALATPIAGRLRLLPRPLALATGATLAAQLGVTPVLLYHFSEVPVGTLVANVLAFPAVSPALLLGLSAAGAGILVPTIGRLLAFVAMAPLRYLETVADRLSTSPLPWITSGGGPWVLVAGLLLVVLVGIGLRRGGRPPVRVAVVAVAIAPILVWGWAVRAGPPDGLTIRFLDVGQGDAALVTSPGGASVLVDAGPDEEQVATELVALGVKRLDVAVATHPHADHIAGFPAVFGRIPVGLVLEPGCDEPSPSYAAFLRAVQDEGLSVRHPRTGEQLAVGDLRIDVLGPPACASGTASDANNDSLVLRISLGDDVALFPGDAEVPAQEWLIEQGLDLSADVLKAPHHGGDTSVDAFFDAVGAGVAVVSVGRPNDYGHPVPSVLDAMAASGAEVLRTDRLGDVVITFAPDGALLASAG